MRTLFQTDTAFLTQDGPLPFWMKAVDLSHLDFSIASMRPGAEDESLIAAPGDTLFSEDFEAFTGAGFDANPGAGQLDSDLWTVTGMSTGADLARGTDADGGVTTGGVYAFTIGGANTIFGIQPGGSDWTPGTIELTYTNGTGGILADIDVVYDLWANNNTARANSFNFSYSTDGVNFIDVSALDYTSTEASDANGFTLVGDELTANLTGINLAAGATLIVRWTGNDVSGSGSRDEFGLDDVRILEGGSGPAPDVDGDANNNVLIGTADAETLNGFDGNDILKGNGGGDILNGGTGIDTASYSQATTGVTIDLTDTANNTGDAAGDVYNSIERYFGSFLDDIFVGDGGNNQFRGRDGDDQFFGNGGIDAFYGDAGADSFDGGDGSDIVSYATSKSGITLDLTTPGDSTGDAAGDTFTDIERINGSFFDDTMTGDANENRLFGLSGNDRLNGEGGDDWLYGSSGEDLMLGGDGFDRFFGGKDNDTMTGGGGRDVFYFGASEGDDTITDFDQDGNDVLVFQAASGATQESDLTITQQGFDVLIEYGASGASILVQNTLVADMTSDDFIFAG